MSVRFPTKTPAAEAYWKAPQYGLSTYTLDCNNRPHS
jgi:hypothetical protein